MHLTTVHEHDDPRIFAKECRSLAAAGYEVHLIAPAPEDRTLDGVQIHAIGRLGESRVRRMTVNVARVYRAARALDAAVYHFHDPELLPAGLLLRAGGSQVIYDSHEDLPRQVLTKPWIPAALRRPLAVVLSWAERLAARRFSAVFSAASYVEERFPGSMARSLTLRNYPLAGELRPPSDDWSRRDAAVCYAGSLTEIRGAREMVRAVARTDAKLLLAGTFNPPSLQDELAYEPGWSQVTFVGQVGLVELARMMGRARAGLVVLRPVPRYVDTMPTKLFDYMSAGIPVIASDFPTWRAIVDRHECGLCVDPTDPTAIADAIGWLLAHPDEAERMGINGRRAVEQHYSWEAEGAKMLDVYRNLVGGEAAAPART